MACMAAATLLAGPLSDALGGRRRVFVLAAAVCMGVSLVWLLMRPDEAGLRIYGIVNGLAFGAYLAVDAALITQVLPDERHVARDLGILNMATAGPQILAPFLASHIVGHLGGYPALLALAAAAAVVSGLAILMVRSVR
jgi:MFS family permease